MTSVPKKTIKFSTIAALVISISFLSGCLGGDDGSNGDDENDNFTSTILAPTSLTAEALSPIAVELSWTDNSTDEDGFKIERRASDTPAFTEIATTGANVTTYEDSGLTFGAQYIYRVKAYNSSGSSDFSNESGITLAASFAGFDFSVGEGTFWDFKWTVSVYADFGSTNYDTSDSFRVQLGAPAAIGEEILYEVELFGNPGGYAPRWRYLSVSDYKIIGSEDGSSVETIFDGLFGYWTGGGFFIDFADNALVRASESFAGEIGISANAIKVGNSSSSDDCTYVEGYGSICGGGGSESFSSFEYYQENIGPIGYYHHYGTSSYDYQYSKTETISLLATSLKGETGLYAQETEPNEYPGSKQPLSLSGSFGKVSLNGDILSGDSFGTVNVTTGIPAEAGIQSADDFQEIHARGVSPQRTPTGVSTVEAEDYYAFTAPHGNSITINLKYSGASGLEMKLLSDTGVADVGPVVCTAAGAEGDISLSYKLISGKAYLIGISAITTPARTSYTLTISY